MFRLLILAVMKEPYTGLYFPVLEILTKQIKYIKLSIPRKKNSKKYLKLARKLVIELYGRFWFKYAIEKPPGIFLTVLKYSEAPAGGEFISLLRTLHRCIASGACTPICMSSCLHLRFTRRCAPLCTFPLKQLAMRHSILSWHCRCVQCPGFMGFFQFRQGTFQSVVFYQQEVCRQILSTVFQSGKSASLLR